jgi:DNA-binding transcriptional ArsR family regulator
MPKTHRVLEDGDGLPEDLLNAIVDTFKALSDPTRAQIIFLLTRREYSVNELSELVPVSASGVSHHLAKLRALHLVNTRRDGNQIFYSIDDEHVGAFAKPSTIWITCAAIYPTGRIWMH